MFVSYPDARFLSGCELSPGAAPIIDKRQGQPYPFRMQFPRDYFKF